MKYIIILRGINVSGKNKLPMVELRLLLDDLQYQNIQTYIQSGNIVLESFEDKKRIASKIKKAIELQFGYEIPIIIKTIEEWKLIIDKNPYKNKEDGKKMYFTFLDTISQIKTIEIRKTIVDEYTILNDIVYVYCENGYGKTTLNNNFFERKLNTTATTRNYKTTIKLLEMSLE